jgi:ribonuclease HI
LDPSLPAINFATPIQYSLSKNDKPTATTEHLNFLQHNTDNIIVYTDGSKGQSLGSVFVIYYKGNILCEHKFPIGFRAEVFDAEVAAITDAIHYLAHNIYIFSDNSSAISTLAQASSGLILRHRQLLQPSIDFLRNQNRPIVLNWVPSYCNIPGNERVDSLAKSTASTPDSPRHPATPFYLKRILKQTRHKLWRKAFENGPRVLSIMEIPALSQLCSCKSKKKQRSHSSTLPTVSQSTNQILPSFSTLPR